MSIGINFLAGLIFLVVCMTASAAAQRPADTWNYYHFDGRSFIAGQPTDGTLLVAIKERFKPMVVAQPTEIEEAELPSGKGAIAGICYIQNSGGKLATGPGYAPYPQLPVQIATTGAATQMIRTDDQGYFVAILDPGTYRIGTAPLTIEVSVEKGITKLVSLRAGKRMVD